jgi:hypothetical protein
MELINVPMPEIYQPCRNQYHWDDVLIYGRCETCGIHEEKKLRLPRDEGKPSDKDYLGIGN